MPLTSHSDGWRTIGHKSQPAKIDVLVSLTRIKYKVNIQVDYSQCPEGGSNTHKALYVNINSPDEECRLSNVC